MTGILSAPPVGGSSDSNSNTGNGVLMLKNGRILCENNFPVDITAFPAINFFLILDYFFECSDGHLESGA